MSWTHGPLCMFDLETTSVDTETARIVTATVAILEPGAKPDIREWLADPGIDIPAEATAIHGITTEHARDNGRAAVDVVADLHSELANVWSLRWPVVGYNVAYDFTVLDRELRRHGGPAGLVLAGPVLDPYILDKGLDRYRKGKRQLSVTCKHYGVHLDDAHNSTADALAAGRLLLAMADRYPTEIADLSLRDLWRLQCRWHKEQAASFSRYLTQEASAMRGAYARGDREYVAQKLAMLGVDEVTPESVEAAITSTVSRAADVLNSGRNWPVRPVEDFVGVEAGGDAA